MGCTQSISGYKTGEWFAYRAESQYQRGQSGLAVQAGGESLRSDEGKNKESGASIKHHMGAGLSLYTPAPNCCVPSQAAISTGASGCRSSLSRGLSQLSLMRRSAASLQVGGAGAAGRRRVNPLERGGRAAAGMGRAKRHSTVSACLIRLAPNPPPDASTHMAQTPTHLCSGSVAVAISLHDSDRLAAAAAARRHRRHAAGGWGRAHEDGG